MADIPGTGTLIDVWVRVVRDVGFPIAVAGILLWFLIAKLDPSIDRLGVVIHDTMHEFATAMHEQTRVFEDAARVGTENNERLRQIMGDHPWSRPARETTPTPTPDTTP